MWLKAHRSEQSRFFKALITLPWVASRRWSGQCRAGLGKAVTCELTAVLLEPRGLNGGADPLCREPAKTARRYTHSSRVWMQD
jgi:hypothetical protein